MKNQGRIVTFKGRKEEGTTTANLFWICFLTLFYIDGYFQLHMFRFLLSRAVSFAIF